MEEGDLEKTELLISKGANLNNISPGKKISIVEVHLISSIMYLSHLKSYEKDRPKYQNTLVFILKNKSLIDKDLLPKIDDFFTIQINFIKNFHIPDLEIKSTDIFSKIEEYLSKVSNIN